MKNFLPYLLFAVTLLLASCSSPLDEDTPRRRTASSNGTSHSPIAAAQVTLSFSLNSGNGNTVTNPFNWQTSLSGTNGAPPVLVDTSASSPAVWIDATLQATNNTAWNNNGSNIVVNSLVLHADSLIPGRPAAFTVKPEEGTGARMVVEEPVPGTVARRTRTFVPNGTSPNGNITKVEHDPGAKRFTVTMAIDNVAVQGGPMRMDGILTIQY